MYKRQPGFRISDSAIDNDVKLVAAMGVEMVNGKEITDIEAVSYTHLDVYKRQVYSRYDTAALVGHAASANLGVILIAFIRIEVPVVLVADAHCVDAVSYTHLDPRRNQYNP